MRAGNRGNEGGAYLGICNIAVKPISYGGDADLELGVGKEAPLTYEQGIVLF